MMVCKACTAQHVSDVSLHAVEQGFEVWCFGQAGLFQNSVSSFDFVNLSRLKAYLLLIYMARVAPATAYPCIDRQISFLYQRRIAAAARVARGVHNSRDV